MQLTVPDAKYLRFKLSRNNKEIQKIDISNPLELQNYLDHEMKRQQKKILYGGYLEKRSLYDKTIGKKSNQELREYSFRC